MSKIKFDYVKFKDYVMGLATEVAKDTAFEIRDDIKKSMVNSPEWSEKTYYREGRKHHPSQPGKPPRIDYGRLHDSISVNWQGSGRTNGEVGSRAYSTDGVSQPTIQGQVVIGTGVPSKDKKGTPLWQLLEGGTTKMKKRPFLLSQLGRYKRIIEKHLKKMGTKKYLLGLAKTFK